MAWSCIGALVSLGGVGWAGAVLAAVPSAGPQHCAVEEATTETSGAFRYAVHQRGGSSSELN